MSVVYANPRLFEPLALEREGFVRRVPRLRGITGPRPLVLRTHMPGRRSTLLRLVSRELSELEPFNYKRRLQVPLPRRLPTEKTSPCAPEILNPLTPDLERWVPHYKGCGPHYDAGTLLSRGPLAVRKFFSLTVMVLLQGFLVAVLVTTATILASPLTYTLSPIIMLDDGTFVGKTVNGTNMFLGIPFAHPPSVLDLCPVHSPP